MSSFVPAPAPPLSVSATCGVTSALLLLAPVVAPTTAPLPITAPIAFTLFSLLPPELRCDIWRLSASNTVVEPYLSLPPPVFHASYESHSACLPLFQSTYFSQRSSPSYLLAPRTGTFSFLITDFTTQDNPELLAALTDFAGLKVQNLQIRCGWFTEACSNLYYNQAMAALLNSPSLSSITLVKPPAQHGLRSILGMQLVEWRDGELTADGSDKNDFRQSWTADRQANGWAWNGQLEFKRLVLPAHRVLRGRRS